MHPNFRKHLHKMWDHWAGYERDGKPIHWRQQWYLGHWRSDGYCKDRHNAADMESWPQSYKTNVTERFGDQTVHITDPVQRNNPYLFSCGWHPWRMTARSFLACIMPPRYYEVIWTSFSSTERKSEDCSKAQVSITHDAVIVNMLRPRTTKAFQDYANVVCHISVAACRNTWHCVGYIHVHDIQLEIRHSQ